MKHALANLLRAALIPELGANVSAGPAGNAHFILITVTAFRAFPDQFAIVILFDQNFPIITADVTVIAFGI